METEFTDLVGINHPIVQAPIGSATCPELAAAVANAGGLGHLAVTWRDKAETRRVIDRTRSLTDGPVAVNLVLDDATTNVPTDEHLATCLDAGARIVSLSFGDGGPYVDQVHDAGGIVFQSVGSAAEARTAEAAGVDAVVTQGWEAGGHVQSEVATLPLVPRVVDAVDVPVVAAGGIADGRGIAAVLSLGAAGAWLGTRFVATAEANVHRAYRERVTAVDETETVYTSLFDKGWPGTAHRVVENDTVRAWRAAGEPEPGDRPGEDGVVAELEDGTPIERYSEALATPDVAGDVDEMALFAGQSAGLTDDVRPASVVVEELVAETEAALARTADLQS
jgi:nitronate monooxygenase